MTIDPRNACVTYIFNESNKGYTFNFIADKNEIEVFAISSKFDRTLLRMNVDYTIATTPTGGEITLSSSYAADTRYIRIARIVKIDQPFLFNDHKPLNHHEIEDMGDHIVKICQMLECEINIIRQDFDLFMRTIEEQFKELERVLRLEWTTFRDALRAEWTAFETKITNEIAAFKAYIIAEWTTFKNTMTAEFNAFKSTVNAAIASMQNQIDVFKSEINKSMRDFFYTVERDWEHFKTLMIDDMSALRAFVNDNLDAFRRDFNNIQANLNIFKSTLETEFQTIKNEWSAFKNAAKPSDLYYLTSSGVTKGLEVSLGNTPSTIDVQSGEAVFVENVMGSPRTVERKTISAIIGHDITTALASLANPLFVHLHKDGTITVSDVGEQSSRGDDIVIGTIDHHGATINDIYTTAKRADTLAAQIEELAYMTGIRVSGGILSKKDHQSLNISGGEIYGIATWGGTISNFHRKPINSESPVDFRFRTWDDQVSGVVTAFPDIPKVNPYPAGNLIDLPDNATGYYLAFILPDGDLDIEYAMEYYDATTPKKTTKEYIDAFSDKISPFCNKYGYMGYIIEYKRVDAKTDPWGIINVEIISDLSVSSAPTLPAVIASLAPPTTAQAGFNVVVDSAGKGLTYSHPVYEDVLNYTGDVIEDLSHAYNIGDYTDASATDPTNLRYRQLVDVVTSVASDGNYRSWQGTVHYTLTAGQLHYYNNGKFQYKTPFNYNTSTNTSSNPIKIMFDDYSITSAFNQGFDLFELTFVPNAAITDNIYAEFTTDITLTKGAKPTTYNMKVRSPNTDWSDIRFEEAFDLTATAVKHLKLTFNQDATGKFVNAGMSFVGLLTPTDAATGNPPITVTFSNSVLNIFVPSVGRINHMTIDAGLLSNYNLTASTNTMKLGKMTNAIKAGIIYVFVRAKKKVVGKPYITPEFDPFDKDLATKVPDVYIEKDATHTLHLLFIAPLTSDILVYRGIIDASMLTDAYHIIIKANIAVGLTVPTLAEFSKSYDVSVGVVNDDDVSNAIKALSSLNNVIPPTSTSDQGKVLTISSNGRAEYASIVQGRTLTDGQLVKYDATTKGLEGSGWILDIPSTATVNSVIGVKTSTTLGVVSAPSSLPAYTTANNGQYLSVVNGTPTWGTLPATPNELPAHTSADNNKVLTIVNNAPTWSVVTSTNELPAHTTADNNKVLTVSNNTLAWHYTDTELPAHTYTDVGKFLKVKNSTSLEWVNLPQPNNELPPYSVNDNGKVLEIVNGLPQFVSVDNARLGIASTEDVMIQAILSKKNINGWGSPVGSSTPEKTIFDGLTSKGVVVKVSQRNDAGDGSSTKIIKVADLATAEDDYLHRGNKAPQTAYVFRGEPQVNVEDFTYHDERGTQFTTSLIKYTERAHVISGFNISNTSAPIRLSWREESIATQNGISFPWYAPDSTPFHHDYKGEFVPSTQTLTTYRFLLSKPTASLVGKTVKITFEITEAFTNFVRFDLNLPPLKLVGGTATFSTIDMVHKSTDTGMSLSSMFVSDRKLVGTFVFGPNPEEQYDVSTNIGKGFDTNKILISDVDGIQNKFLIIDYSTTVTMTLDAEATIIQTAHARFDLGTLKQISTGTTPYYNGRISSFNAGKITAIMYIDLKKLGANTYTKGLTLDASDYATYPHLSLESSTGANKVVIDARTTVYAVDCCTFEFNRPITQAEFDNYMVVLRIENTTFNYTSALHDAITINFRNVQ